MDVDSSDGDNLQEEVTGIQVEVLNTFVCVRTWVNRGRDRDS